MMLAGEQQTKVFADGDHAGIYRVSRLEVPMLIEARTVRPPAQSHGAAPFSLSSRVQSPSIDG